MKKGNTIIPLVFLFLIFISIPALGVEDTIVKVAGKPILKVEVVEEDVHEVRYKREGIPTVQRVPADLVKEIIWGDAPESFTSGMDLIQQGHYENAVGSLKIARGQRARSWLKLYSDFYQAKALLLWGKTNRSKLSEAQNIYNQLLTQHSSHRLTPEIILNIGNCLTRLKEFSKAEDHLRDFERRVFNENYSTKWKCAVKKLSAQLSEAKGEYGIAVTKWKSLEDFAKMNGLLDVETQAISAQGKAILLTNDLPKAETYFRDLIRQYGTDQGKAGIIAAAHNGLGECFFQEKNYRKAYLSFCEVRVNFFQSTEERARATYWAGRCAEEISKENPKAASSYRQLSKSYFNEVSDKYSDTEWAKKVKSLEGK